MTTPRSTTPAAPSAVKPRFLKARSFVVVGLLGMAMVASGSSFKRSIPFFALGLMALVIFRPKRAELENIIRYGKFLAS